MSYNGKKFYPAGEVEYYDDLGFKRTKTHFVVTKAYKAYLAEKHAEEEHMELVALKHKLEYQRKHYGEVDKYFLKFRSNVDVVAKPHFIATVSMESSDRFIKSQAFCIRIRLT